MGKWVELVHYSDLTKPPTTLGGVKYEGVKDGFEIFYIPDEFVEFGFDFKDTDTSYSSYYSYSGIFWTVDRGKAKKIFISSRSNLVKTVLTIKVNDKEIFQDDDCFNHVQYDWKAEDKIIVRTVKTKNYSLNVTRFHARKSSTAKWECFLDTSDGNNIAYVPSDYVEFGFEFDIYLSTRWPYSGVFWGAKEAEDLKSKGGKVEDIHIKMAGTAGLADISIYVNGHKEFRQTNCSSHERYDWSEGPGLSAPTKLKVLQRGAFATSEMNFYGRKPGGKWEKIFSFGNSGGEETVPDGYVDFGFEFNPMAGTYDGGDTWPYSWPFFLAAEHPGSKVKSISITVGGYLWIFGSTHIDITVQGYDANGGYSSLVSYSKHDLDDTSPNKWKQYSW